MTQTWLDQARRRAVKPLTRVDAVHPKERRVGGWPGELPLITSIVCAVDGAFWIYAGDFASFRPDNDAYAPPNDGKRRDSLGYQAGQMAHRVSGDEQKPG